MESPLYWFKDYRHYKVFNLLLDRISERFSLIMLALSDHSSETRRFGRFIRNKSVRVLQMLQTFSSSLDASCNGKHILLIQDTSEISFGYEPSQTGLGPVGNGLEQGFFIHPVLAVDSATFYCLGLAHVEVYKRPVPAPQGSRPFEEKLSYRWLKSVLEARKRCPSAAGHIVVSDKEGDIYEALSAYIDQGLGFVVRSDINRCVYTSEDKLHESINSWPVVHSYDMVLPRTDKRSAHKASLEVRCGEIKIARPSTYALRKSQPAFLSVNVVEVREMASTVVGKENPVHWVLFTSLPVETLELAMFVVACYIHRWTIEQFFRTMKAQGLKIEDNQAEDYDSLAKITVLGLIAAVKVLQLVAARDGGTPIQASSVFSDNELKVLEKINPKFEGSTLNKKNPHPKESLAFATWVIARLGGWKGSPKERKPGPIRMLRGLQKFETFCEAALIFSDG